MVVCATHNCTFRLFRTRGSSMAANTDGMATVLKKFFFKKTYNSIIFALNK